MLCSYQSSRLQGEALHRLEQVLDAPALKGARWGLCVRDAHGGRVIDMKADEAFIPASTTKLFTTAAIFHNETSLASITPATCVHRRARPHQPDDLVLVGGGDALLDEATGLASLARQIVDAGVTEISDLIGDDTLFPDQRWVGSWPMRAVNMAPVSALTLDNNAIPLSIQPADREGALASVRFLRDSDHYTLVTEIRTIAQGCQNDIRIERMQGSSIVRVHGTVAIGSQPAGLSIGIVDPALYAAEKLANLLRAHGVAIAGAITTRRRTLSSVPDSTPSLVGTIDQGIACHPASPLLPVITVTNKMSQNLYADLLLRRLALLEEGRAGSIEAGLAVVGDMLDGIGIARDDWLFYDGSGLSYEGRLRPAAVVRFLRWAAAQPWAETWRRTLPVAAIDGTLEHRFLGMPLASAVSAKTGTLFGVAALAGYLTAKSGQELTFAIYANDVRPDAASAVEAIDQALNIIAAAV